jgi:hypothetical protein
MSFAEAFCKRFGCREETYETSVLWRCLACRLSLITRLVAMALPSFFKDELEELEAIRRLGTTRSAEEFLRELDDVDYVAHRRGGFFRLRAGLRVSVRRLDRLQASLFG